MEHLDERERDEFEQIKDRQDERLLIEFIYKTSIDSDIRNLIDDFFESLED